MGEGWKGRREGVREKRSGKERSGEGRGGRRGGEM